MNPTKMLPSERHGIPLNSISSAILDAERHPTTTKHTQRNTQHVTRKEIDPMNTNAKHTPGPWENHKWNCEEHQISAKGGTIALVSHSHSLVSEAEADANARLIAAAPILAEHLAELLEATETLARRHGTPLPQCHQYAKAALAKAEGGAQ